MATKVNFSFERIAGFKFVPSENGKSNQTVYWDAKTPGLGLRVTSAGAKSYIFETRLNKKTVRMTIGDIRTWTIGDAQKEATKLKGKTDQGIDPRKERADKVAEDEMGRVAAERLTATFGDVWPEYLESNKKHWGDRHYKDHINLSAIGGQIKVRGKGLTVSGPLASLNAELLINLSGDRITEWLESEMKVRQTSAALAFRLLRAFIRWAAESKKYRGLIPDGSYNANSVKRTLPQRKSKDDCLQREQLQSWFESVANINNPVIAAYLQALLITGARREELLGLKWVDVDFKWKTIVIRDKIEGQRVIPLTPYVAELLQNLKQLNQIRPSVRQLRTMKERNEKFVPSPWVFFSRASADGKLSEPRPAHMIALEIAGIPHITLHGLRRSFGTLCEWVEVPAGISAQIMGHKPTAIAEKHYRVRPIDLLRQWHEKIEAWILAESGIKFMPVKAGLHAIK
jgi:integrase